MRIPNPAMVVALSLLILSPLAGCSKPGEPPVVEAHHDASGDTIHVNNEQAKRNLDRAGQEIKRDAQNVGSAVENGAKDVKERVGPAAREALSDAGLTTKVKTRLLAAPDVHAMNVTVSSRDGRVTLSGRVETASEKADVLKIAARTEGVKDVVDEIQIGPAT